jgi:hypothetical protein
MLQRALLPGVANVRCRLGTSVTSAARRFASGPKKPRRTQGRTETPTVSLERRHRWPAAVIVCRRRTGQDAELNYLRKEIYQHDIEIDRSEITALDR